MLYLITNPIAGRGRALQLLEQFRAYAQREGLELTCHLTQGPHHATELAASFPADATILSLGGDGTLHEIALSCIGTERTIGIIPGGSGDDFAKALGIDKQHLDHAFAVIKSSKIKQVDTAEVNGMPFVNALGVGFDAEVAHNVHRAPRVLKGHFAYLYAILGTLGKFQAYPVEVIVDGKPFYAGPAVVTSVQNGPRTGGGFYFAPKATVEDGVLDLLVGGRIGRAGLMKLLPKLMKGAPIDHPEVKMVRGQHIELIWDTPRLAHTEGELLDAATHFSVKIKPKSLRVLAP